MPMAAEKITKALKKALFRLEAMDKNEALSILDREMIGKLLLEAYEDLWTYELDEEEHPGRNEHFEFEVETEEPKTVAPPEEKVVSEQPQSLPETEKVDNPVPVEEVNVKEEAKDELEVGIPNTSQQESKPPQEHISDNLQEIFAVKQSKELSERLSQLPIDDIWTAMGLNERIFTQNELFGGDHDLFKTTVQKIDKMNSFDEAKRYLIDHIALDQNWEANDRIKIAKNFVKLIQRRF